MARKIPSSESKCLDLLNALTGHESIPDGTTSVEASRKSGSRATHEHLTLLRRRAVVKRHLTSTAETICHHFDNYNIPKPKNLRECNTWSFAYSNFKHRIDQLISRDRQKAKNPSNNSRLDAVVAKSLEKDIEVSLQAYQHQITVEDGLMLWHSTSQREKDLFEDCDDLANKFFGEYTQEFRSVLREYRDYFAAEMKKRAPVSLQAYQYKITVLDQNTGAWVVIGNPAYIRLRPPMSSDERMKRATGNLKKSLAATNKLLRKRKRRKPPEA
jgi:hypothetical protein